MFFGPLRTTGAETTRDQLPFLRATQRNTEALLSSPTRVARKPDIATNPDIGGQVGVTYEKENGKEEDAYRAHYVGSRVVRLTL